VLSNGGCSTDIKVAGVRAVQCLIDPPRRETAAVPMKYLPRIYERVFRPWVVRRLHVARSPFAIECGWLPDVACITPRPASYPVAPSSIRRLGWRAGGSLPS
jgi:hypothetical protein